MIISKVVIGYDGKAVKAGFADIDKHAKGIGSKLFNFSGAGGFGKMIAGVTALGAAIKIAMGGKEMLDFGGELQDLKTQTGMLIPDLVVLQEWFKSTGVDAADAGMAISRMVMNLKKAQEAGPEQDAIHSLGFLAGEIDPSRPMDMIKKIANAVKTMARGEQEIVMKALFGKSGYKLLRALNDIDASLAEAEKTGRKIGDAFDNNIGSIDNAGDAIGRLDLKFKYVYEKMFEGLQKVFGKDFVPKMLDDWFSSDRITGFVDELTNAFKTLGASLKNNGVLGTLKNVFVLLGNFIGQGIAQYMTSGAMKVADWIGAPFERAGFNANMQPDAKGRNGGKMQGGGIELNPAYFNAIKAAWEWISKERPGQFDTQPRQAWGPQAQNAKVVSALETSNELLRKIYIEKGTPFFA
jgi:hypothetical protein